MDMTHTTTRRPVTRASARPTAPSRGSTPPSALKAAEDRLAAATRALQQARTVADRKYPAAALERREREAAAARVAVRQAQIAAERAASAAATAERHHRARVGFLAAVCRGERWALDAFRDRSSEHDIAQWIGRPVDGQPYTDAALIAAARGMLRALGAEVPQQASATPAPAAAPDPAGLAPWNVVFARLRPRQVRIGGAR